MVARFHTLYGNLRISHKSRNSTEALKLALPLLTFPATSDPHAVCLCAKQAM